MVALMTPGKLNHEVTIQSLVPSQDAVTGAITEVWENFAIVWANIRPSSAREFIAAAISNSKVIAVVTIRYRPGMKPSMRILHRNHTYQIEGVLGDQKSGLEYLTLPVSEVQDG